MRSPRRGTRRRSGLILSALLAAVMTTTAAAAPSEDAEPGQIIAMFRDASPILVGNDVKLQGAPVGKVSSMVVEGQESAIGLAIDPTIPLHRDARVTIQPVSLLGERFLELDPGSPTAPLLEPGARIPSSQTAQPPDLDQVLNALGDPTGTALASFVTNLGGGLKGNGRNADAALKALAPAMQDTGALVGTLSQQTQLLQHLVDRTEPIAGALAADEGKRLDRLVDTSKGLLDTTASRQQALEQTLIELPGFLQKTRGALQELAGVTRNTTPTLRELRPTTDNLEAIGHELQNFADSADPALASAGPVLDSADKLLAQARPVVRDLRPAGPPLRGVAKNLAPITNKFTDHLPGFWGFIEGWALATNGRDGISHYFRGLVTLSPDQLDVLGGGLPLGAAQKAAGPKLPGLGAAGKPATGLLGKGKPADAAQGGATGLDRQQEGNAMSQLLGGGQ